MDNLKQGIIIKIDSNKSWVAANEDIYQLDIKKSLLQTHKPLVGDKVDFEVTHEQDKRGLIIKFRNRFNVLPKPKIANIDQAVIVTSLREPDFNSYLLNKYLIFLNLLKIKPILLFTKSDLTRPGSDTDFLKKARVYEKMGYKALIISNKKLNQKETTLLNQIFQGKTSVLVGQTGAGKSTILNRLRSNEKPIKTQEVSHALHRGKHTTTSTQLYFIGSDGLVADTPGFGNFDLNKFPIRDLISNLPFLEPYLGACKYQDCLHVLEETCSLRQNKNFPKEAQFIYEDYCRIISELRSKKGLCHEKNHRHS